MGKRKKTIFTLLEICTVIVIAGISCVVFVGKVKQKGGNDEIQNTSSQIESAETTQNPGTDSEQEMDASSSDNYIGETAYDDSVSVNKAVFHYPFQSTAGYVSNRDLTQELNKDTLKKYEAFAKEFAELYLGTSYRSIEGSEEDYAEKLTKYFDPEATLIDRNGNEQSVDDFCLSHAQWISDQKLQVETTFTTANFLVYWDGGYHVRGTLDISAYGCEAETMNATIPSGIDLSKSGSYVCDIAFQNFSQNQDVSYQIKSFEILGKIE